MKSVITTRKNKKNKQVVLICVSILLIFILVACFVFTLSKFVSPSKSTSKGSPSSLDAPTTINKDNNGDSTKQDIINSQSNPNMNNNNSTPLSASITAASQNGSTLQIRVLIQKVSNSGTCILNLTQGSLSKTYTVGIQASASSSTCEGFDIPISDLNSTGSWAATATITINAQTTRLSQDIIIK